MMPIPAGNLQIRLNELPAAAGSMLYRLRTSLALAICGASVAIALLLDWYFQLGALDSLLLLRLENARRSTWLASWGCSHYFCCSS